MLDPHTCDPLGLFPLHPEAATSGAAADAQSPVEILNLEELQAARDGGPRSLSIAGDTAELAVEGILVQRQSFWLWLLGYAQTSYSDLQAAIAEVRGNPEIKSVPLGTAELLRDGDAAAIIAIGSMVHPALEAAAELSAEGISVAVLNARFAKPLDVARIAALASRCGALVSVEEHVGAGGFGAAVLEALASVGAVARVRCLAVPDAVVEHGDSGAIKRGLGLDSEGIARAVRDLLSS